METRAFNLCVTKEDMNILNTGIVFCLACFLPSSDNSALIFHCRMTITSVSFLGLWMEQILSPFVELDVIET